MGLSMVYNLIEDIVLSEMDTNELEKLEIEITEVYGSIVLLMKRIRDEKNERDGE